MTASFDLSAWLNGEHESASPLNREVPQRPDNYRPGPISWGKDPKRGHAIQRARANKAHAMNLAFFLETVLPTIEFDLDPLAWNEIGVITGADLFRRKGGWVLYRKEDRQSWIHPELNPEQIRAAIAMGAEEVPMTIRLKVEHTEAWQQAIVETSPRKRKRLERMAHEQRETFVCLKESCSCYRVRAHDGSEHEVIKCLYEVVS